VLCILSVLAIFAVFVDFLLFCWREEATGDFLEDFVGYLLSAVADGFES
jgi:hypothetical protein